MKRVPGTYGMSVSRVKKGPPQKVSCKNVLPAKAQNMPEHGHIQLLINILYKARGGVTSLVLLPSLEITRKPWPHNALASTSFSMEVQRGDTGLPRRCTTV